jgi:hypothetical protein
MSLNRVNDENWLKWAFAVESDNSDRIRMSCHICKDRMFPGIWEYRCDSCGFTLSYILPDNSVATWTDPHIPGRYGIDYAKITNHVK